MRFDSFPIGQLARSMPDDGVRLSSSEPEPLTLGELATSETFAMLGPTILGYPHGQGGLSLRTAIAARYEGISPEDIVVFNGAAEAIFVLLNVLTEIGDEIVTPSPGHSPFIKVPHAGGVGVRVVELDRQDDYRLDIDRLMAACTVGTRAVIVNYPHNPTGTTIDEITLRYLVESSNDRGIPLVVDEIFRGLERPGVPQLPSAVELSDQAVVVGGLSKSLAIAGIRIGWIVTRRAGLVSDLVDFRDYTSLSNSAVDEELAVLALGRYDELLERVRTTAHSNLTLLENFIADHDVEVAMVRPDAGLLAFPWFRDGRDTTTLARALAPAGVLMFPGAAYGAEYSSHFRVGYGRKNFATALERLDGVLSDSKAVSV